MDLIDITRSVGPTTAVWPGDQPVEWTWTARLDDGASVNLGAVCLSTHTGTHVDAPFHISDEGRRTDGLPVSPFIGQAEVVTVTDADAVRPDHVANVRARRILFKTPASAVPTDTWPRSVTPVRPGTIDALAEQDVELIGTDAPSIDPLDSSSLPGHEALFRNDMVNLEGLTLQDVDSGLYTLLSLPMRLESADAAPVRAVLGAPSLLDED